MYSHEWWEGTTYGPKLVVTYDYNTGPDTTAPAVSLTAPADGATVGGTYAVTASATDDRGVARVDFAIDGAVEGLGYGGALRLQLGHEGATPTAPTS